MEFRAMMIDWFLVFLRDLALIAWLGGLAVIDFLEAPIRFRVPEIDRNQSVAIGRRVFAALNLLELCAGALILAATALLALRIEVGANELIAFGLVALMWLVVLVQFLWLRPRMSQLARGLDLVNRRPDDVRYAQVGRLHRVYVGCDLLKIALGIVVVALWVKV